MALKAILAKIDEVEEPFRSLYTERNGKWEFTGVDGLKTQADIDRVQEAHRKTRTDLEKAQGELKTANTKLQAFGEVEPEEITAKLEKLATYEAGQNVPELLKNFETTVATRAQQLADQKVKQETTKLQRRIDELSTENGTLKGTVDTYAVKDNTRTIHDAVRAEATKLKVLPEAIPDLLLIAGQDLRLQDGRVTTEDGRDPAAWLQDAKEKRPYFWPAAQGTGSRGSEGLGAGGPNPFARANHNMTAISKIVAENPTQAAKLAEIAGVPKTADGTFQWHVMPAK